MPKSHKKKGGVSPDMNMTPMIDVIFQLIIFFMLVNQIIAEQLVQMIVPELDEPKTVEIEEDGRLIVNIAPSPYNSDRGIGELTIPGEATLVKVGLNDFSIDDIDAVKAALKEAKESADAAGQPLRILLRADAALYFEAVQPVMQAIASAQIQTVHLVAYLPEDQR